MILLFKEIITLTTATTTTTTTIATTITTKQSKQLQSQQSQPTSQIETSQPPQQKSRRMAHILSEKKGERILIQDLKNLKALYQVADPEAVKIISFKKMLNYNNIITNKIPNNNII
ncbi:hypothetical protein Glove_43g75 [Diversispora epigaea]|uniref:Uncharacterized protein n=1 Tax=Diversispora epigaea TaxID=1348612 RepID=A0A397JJ74_9GLOM|nr:hypothetical protein Glove_43g75 [Diversispora epigaea]